jgi:uncharacterized membrane protein
MANLSRLLAHIGMTRWQMARTFPRRSLQAIERAIAAAEQTHGGELRFVVERELDFAELWYDVTPRQRAVRLFGELGVWDTDGNNGVLIYVLLADRDVEIVADRGYAGKVSPHEWEQACRAIEQAYRQGDFAGGTLTGIAAVSQLMARHYPVADNNELADSPLVL